MSLTSFIYGVNNPSTLFPTSFLPPSQGAPKHQRVINSSLKGNRLVQSGTSIEILPKNLLEIALDGLSVLSKKVDRMFSAMLQSFSPRLAQASDIGQVSMFNGDDCPLGWEEVVDARGRYLRAKNGAILPKTGGNSNLILTSNQMPQHEHWQYAASGGNTPLTAGNTPGYEGPELYFFPDENKAYTTIGTSSQSATLGRTSASGGNSPVSINPDYWTGIVCQRVNGTNTTQLTSNISQLENKVTNLTREFEAFEVEISNQLTSEVSRVENKVTNLTREFEAFEVEISNQLTSEISRVENKVANLTREFEEFEGEISNQLTSEVSRVENKVTNLTKEFEEFEGEISSQLTSEVSRVENKVTNLTREFEEFDVQISDILSNINGSSQQVSLLTLQLAQLRSNFTTTRSRVDQLDQTLSNLSSILFAIGANLDNVTLELSDLGVDFANLESSVNSSLIDIHAQIANHYQEAQVQHANFQQDVQFLNSTISHVRNHLALQNETIARWREETAEALKEVIGNISRQFQNLHGVNTSSLTNLIYQLCANQTETPILGKKRSESQGNSNIDLLLGLGLLTLTGCTIALFYRMEILHKRMLGVHSGNRSEEENQQSQIELQEIREDINQQLNSPSLNIENKPKPPPHQTGMDGGESDPKQVLEKYTQGQEESNSSQGTLVLNEENSRGSKLGSEGAIEDSDDSFLNGHTVDFNTQVKKRNNPYQHELNDQNSLDKEDSKDLIVEEMHDEIVAQGDKVTRNFDDNVNITIDQKNEIIHEVDKDF